MFIFCSGLIKSLLVLAILGDIWLMPSLEPVMLLLLDICFLLLFFNLFELELRFEKS